MLQFQHWKDVIVIATIVTDFSALTDENDITTTTATTTTTTTATTTATTTVTTTKQTTKQTKQTNKQTNEKQTKKKGRRSQSQSCLFVVEYINGINNNFPKKKNKMAKKQKKWYFFPPPTKFATNYPIGALTQLLEILLKWRADKTMIGEWFVLVMIVDWYCVQLWLIWGPVMLRLYRWTRQKDYIWHHKNDIVN